MDESLNLLYNQLSLVAQVELLVQGGSLSLKQNLLKGGWTIEQSKNWESLVTNVVRLDTFPKIVPKNRLDKRYYRDQLRKSTVNGVLTDRIVLDTGASTTIVHQRMVSEKDYTRDAVTITDSGGTIRLYPMAQVIIQLQGDHEFSQEVAVSVVVPENVLLGSDAPIGVPLFRHLSRQVRKAMWEKMNQKFTGAVVTRSQTKRIRSHCRRDKGKKVGVLKCLNPVTAVRELLKNKKKWSHYHQK